MNEFNIDKEEPDQHWEGFKKFLFLVGGILALIIMGCFKYCK